MDYEIKREARKQFLKYFRIWFIVIGVLAVVALGSVILNAGSRSAGRRNSQAPAERVYDLADVLTQEEEQQLRELIAETEKKIQADIVLVTENCIMEGAGAPSDGSWETNMMNAADDFYDENGFGYDQVCGDGMLLLDNWYSGQAGSWLSTSGRMINEFSTYEIDRVLDAVYYYVDRGAYIAYKKAIQEIGAVLGVEEHVSFDRGTYMLGAFLISTVVAVVFICTKLKVKEGTSTVSINTYVEGSPHTNVCQDRFIRKVVTRRHIPRNNNPGGGPGRSGGPGGGGGHRSGGGGGSHRSSSGGSHGGGGRRR